MPNIKTAFVLYPKQVVYERRLKLFCQRELVVENKILYVKQEVDPVSVTMSLAQLSESQI
jgi:hypothetical protein